VQQIHLKPITCTVRNVLLHNISDNTLNFWGRDSHNLTNETVVI